LANFPIRERGIRKMDSHFHGNDKRRSGNDIGRDGYDRRKIGNDPSEIRLHRASIKNIRVR